MIVKQFLLNFNSSLIAYFYPLIRFLISFINKLPTSFINRLSFIFLLDTYSNYMKFVRAVAHIIHINHIPSWQRPLQWMFHNNTFFYLGISTLSTIWLITFFVETPSISFSGLNIIL